jgi:hypothetical protein
MKDLFGNRKPIQIEIDEWWFNGRIIIRQRDSRLPRWISFEDSSSPFVEIDGSKKDAITFALHNPCKNPKNLGIDYI